MLGGNFYALTDDQLNRILAGSLDGDAFLSGTSAEKPAACFSHGELVWYELTKILAAEDGCGANTTDAVPEGGAYSHSSEVQETSASLETLTEEEIRLRYSGLDTPHSFDEIFKAVVGLSAFYQRTQSAGHAMLFNIR